MHRLLLLPRFSSAVAFADRRRRRALSPRRTPSSRRALSLIEMLLVLAIIVAIVAIAVPAIQGTINSQSLVKAGDRVRNAMGQARVRAIRTGDVQALFYARGGTEFQVAPFVNGGQLQSQQLNQQRPFERDYNDTQLPRGIRFAAGELIVNSRDSAQREEAGNSSGLESILFYPDGTSQNARLILQNEIGSLVAVELRGLTGVAKSFRMDSTGGGVR